MGLVLSLAVGGDLRIYACACSCLCAGKLDVCATCRNSGIKQLQNRTVEFYNFQCTIFTGRDKNLVQIWIEIFSKKNFGVELFF